mgnify:CR=1 FL=1
MITGKYPSLRLRRNRKSNWSRKLIQENTLSPSDFILPIFLIDGSNKKESIKSMPNVYRYTINRLAQIIDKATEKHPDDRFQSCEDFLFNIKQLEPRHKPLLKRVQDLIQMRIPTIFGILEGSRHGLDRYKLFHSFSI